MLTEKTKPLEATTSQAITDQNGDGIINLVDARLLAPPQTVNCPVCVDVNGDKKIDSMDVYLVRFNAGLESPDEGKYSYKPRLDVNNDGVLSQADADIIQTYVGQGVQAPAFGLDDPSELTFGYVADELLVKFKIGVVSQQKSPIFTKFNANAKESFNLVNTDKIKINTNNIEALQKQLNNESDVEKAYKNHVGELMTNDPYWQNQWGHRQIRIEETWYTETKGSATNPVQVAVIDTGLDVNHPDIQKNLSSTRRNILIDSPQDPDYSNVDDTEGHGTLMSGIIAATANNDKGIAGLAQNVELIPIKAGASVSDSAIGKAFEWIIGEVNRGDLDIKVINMSFGYGYTDSNSFLTNFHLQYAREKLGIVLVASAGNDGRGDCEYPARHQNVICVGATNAQDAICNLSSGKSDADILAPGSEIISLSAAAIDADGNGVHTSSGCWTSQAAAYISGVAALCRTVSFLPKSTEITREDLKCKNMNHQGYGRVDAWATLWWRNCHKYDFNNDLKINTLDAQSVAFRFNQPSTYNILYDIAPVGTDGRIDLGDVYAILQRDGLFCPAW